ncbi:MAG: hypothetical protein H8E27_05990 [Verrucomicrobia subdivision 3 bacterium]|nr:hypothetical protein [Limisphaerales bacterium]
MRLLRIGIVCALLLPAAEAADSVVWHPKARTFDMNVRAMGLERLLGVIKAETGWEVLVEPGLKGRVEAKFRNKPAADAMRFLLGDKRFSLVPRTKGGTRLMVYESTLRGATQQVEAAMLAYEAEPLQPGEDDGRPLTLKIKVHHLRSNYASINADSNLTNIRPLIAGVNEMWKTANIRFVADRPLPLRVADRGAEKDFAELFKPGVSATAVAQLQSRILHKMLPDLPDRGKVFHIVVIYTMPRAYGAVYLPAKGMVLMPQVKFAALVDADGVWKDGSPVFFAQSNILAHEMGHSLSLPHVATQGNLMIDGKLREGAGVGPGSNLSAKQIIAARRQAFTGGPYVPGINPKPNPLQKPKLPED